jgi:hypothetical protein
MTGYRNLTEPGPKWEPVQAPTPQFGSVAEVKAWQEATARNPRIPGEDICEWADRVAKEAKAITAPRLPYVEREPGEDSDD